MKSLLILLLLCSSAFADRRAVINVDSVPLRASNLASAEILGYLYKNMMILVIDEVDPKPGWYHVNFEGKDGYVLEEQVTFTIPPKLPDTYESPGDMGWFYAKYGDGTGYQRHALGLSSFTVDEYRKLIKSAESGNPISADVLQKTLVPHIAQHPDDKKYEYLKRRLQTPYYARVLARKGKKYFDKIFSKQFLKDNRDVAEELVRANPQLISAMPEAIQNDRSLAISMVQVNPFSYRVLGEKLQRDPAVLNIMLKRGLVGYSILPEELRGNRELALSAAKESIEKHPAYMGELSYVHWSLLNDKEFVVKTAELLKIRGNCFLWTRMPAESRRQFKEEMAQVNPACAEEK